MPNIDDMFQSRYISFRDLEPNKSYQGTIHSVEVEAAKGNTGTGGNPGYQGGAGRGVQADWILWFREWQKPFKLKPNKARLLAAMFRTKVTEEWAGKVVTFYRGTTVIGNEPVESLNIDDRPTLLNPAGPQGVGAGTARAALASPPPKPKSILFDPGKKNTIIPPAALTRFTTKLAEFEKTWDDFLGWLKGQSREGHDLVIGHALDNISGAVLPAMGTYVDLLSKPPAPAAPPADGPGYTHKPGDPGYIAEEDIPF